MHRQTTLLLELKKMPPYAARLSARHKLHALTSRQIAERGGMDHGLVKTISASDTWMPFRIESVIRFYAACGIEILHLREELDFMRRTDGYRNSAHIKRLLKPNGCTPTVRKFYMRLLDKMDSLRKKTRPEPSLSGPTNQPTT